MMSCEGTKNGFDNEFQTVELILKSESETRGVDAFALALIKSERQMRKLVTHLVFQYPCFDCTSTTTSELRKTLAKNGKVYFDGLITGFDAIYPRSIADLIGECHGPLKCKLDKAVQHRNKIFHGQLTPDGLRREELIIFVNDLSKWCKLLATTAEENFGYDGFGRNSFQKSKNNELHQCFKQKIASIEEYKTFITNNMERRRCVPQPVGS